MARFAIAREISGEASKPPIRFDEDVELLSWGCDMVSSVTFPVNRVSNATSSAGSVAGPKFRVKLSVPSGKTYETLKPELVLRLRSAYIVSKTYELSLSEEIETLRFCRQNSIEHRSALKIVPGEEARVEVLMNAYRPNPDGVRFVSAIPSELSAKAMNRGIPLRPVTWDPFTVTLKVDVVRLAELGFLKSELVK